MAGTGKDLKGKAEEVSREFNELTEEELTRVSGGLLNGHEMHAMDTGSEVKKPRSFGQPG